MSRAPRTFALGIALAACGGGEARAMAPVVGHSARVTDETSLIVWDGATRRQVLVVSARLAAGATAGGVVFPVPHGATPVEVDAGVVRGFAALTREAAPLPFLAGGQLSFAGASGKLAELMGAAGVTPDRAVLAWGDGLAQGARDVAVLRTEGDEAPYAAMTFPTEHPLLPFAEPASADRESDPPPIDELHPPRVRLWLELGAESATGVWERKMDGVLAALGPALSACYAVELAGKKRLSGDLHVQMRLLPAGVATVEGERASSKPLSRVAACFSPSLEKAAWPTPPGKRAAAMEVHALVRPPLSVPHTLRAFILASHDISPHLGNPRDPRVPPDTRVVLSEEPEPALLARVFDARARGALGLDTTRRWRLVVLESTAHPRPTSDDIVFRRLAPLPAAKPGEPELPLVARGDREGGPNAQIVAPAPRKRRWGRWLLAALTLGGVGAVVVMDQRLRARDRNA